MKYKRPRRPARRQGLRPPIGVVLLLVALIPLLGLASFTSSSIGDARAAGESAESAKALAREAVTLAELNASIFEELIWVVSSTGVEAAGVPADLIARFTDQAPSEMARSTQQRTNALVAKANRPDVHEALIGARDHALSVPDRAVAYNKIIDSVQNPLEQLLDQATSAAIATGDGELLAKNIEVLRATDSFRALASQEFFTFFAATFDMRGTPAEEAVHLIVLRSEVETTLAKLRSNPNSSQRVLDTVTRVESDPASTTFIASIDQLIDRRLLGETPLVGAPITLESLAANLEPFLNAIESLTIRSDLSLQMVNAAADSVLDVAEAIRVAEQQRTERTYMFALSLLAAATFAGLVASLFVIRPLRRLQTAAEHLQHDNSPRLLRSVGGPSEVQAAGNALEEATLHFELVTRQAQALSAGELDAAALDEVAPGGLGAALQHAVGTLRSALTQQEEFRQRLAHEATHDGLTGIANRNSTVAHLASSLARTERSGEQLAVLFIDLDKFKEVNDSLGHQAGDTVLSSVAQRLIRSVREGDHVGRLGGDEFVVIAEAVSGIDEAFTIAQRMLDALSNPIEHSTGPISIGASIGIAMNDRRSLTADELLRDADLAVYRAKDHGRGAIAVCDEDLRKTLLDTADLTVALRNAIAKDELTLHYQPIVDSRTAEVDGTAEIHALEALVRWRLPGRDELMPPDEFIGFAERSSLIIDIDCWVLDKAIGQAARWKSDPRLSGIPIAINISSRHLANDNFVDNVAAPLAKYGVDPAKIIVEVTESAILHDLGAAAVKFQRLRDIGVRISIDDFGTGYTSLAHLRSLPIDELKIDRSFTANAGRSEQEASLVKLIIDIAHLLGATVTAEGIETHDDAAILASLGSDTLQGYYFARPMAPEDLVSRTTATVN